MTKVDDMSLDQLNWAVSQCVGGNVQEYCTDWSVGGPLINEYGISVALRYASRGPNHCQDVWDAVIKPEFYSTGRPDSGVKVEVVASGFFPLHAAMKCLVVSRKGKAVEFPDIKDMAI